MTNQEPTSSVISSGDQHAMTPATIVERLKAGNQHYVDGELTTYDHLAQIPKAALGQQPMAAVVSCVDSRVIVENIFDAGIGDLFVARVAGNFVNTDILGSLEFATAVSGSKVVVVLGHESCGAVRAAIDGADLGNITPMLTNITPAVESTDGDNRESSNKDFVAGVVEQNVRLTLDRIRNESPVMAELETSDELAIVGAIYSLTTGKVSFLG